MQHDSPPSSNSPTASAHGGAPDSSGPKAPKDRPCPFCRQPFTSSSLGRHLDLYIKDRNPKPPDGVHDVDAIRKIRGRITRRHARGPGHRDHGDPPPSPGPSSAHHRHHSEATAAPGGPLAISTASPTPGAYTGPLVGLGRTFNSAAAQPWNGNHNTPHNAPVELINKLDWQATGVINDLPPRQFEDNTLGEREKTIEKSFRAGYPSARMDREAAEVALRDVLSSIQQAVTRVQRPGPFSFDVMSCNFPALCLALLPAPPALFSTTPVPAPGSWSLEPPGQAERDACSHSIRNRITVYYTLSPPSEIKNVDSVDQYHELVGRAVDKIFEDYAAHIRKIYDEWTTRRPEQRAEIWRLELMRAYATEQSRHEETTLSCERARDSIEEMHRELQRLRHENTILRHGETADISHHTNRAPVISAALVKQMHENEPDTRLWDFDKIMERYLRRSGGLRNGGGAEEAKARHTNGDVTGDGDVDMSDSRFASSR